MEAAVAKADLPKLGPAAREQLARYLAMIANIDENMGRLDAFLRETGLRDNTIVVFLTDNGSTFGPRYFNAGMKGGKVTLWEGGHRVPCFVRWPAGGLRPAGDVTGLTEVQDLLPTLLDLAGVKPPAAREVRRPQPGRRAARDQRTAGRPHARGPVQPHGPPGAAARATPACCGDAGGWCRTRNSTTSPPIPAQERNVIAEHPEIAARLRPHYAAVVGRRRARAERTAARRPSGTTPSPLSLLSPCEWHDVFLDQSAQVRRGERKNGVWHLEVARAGEYEFELRRWPRERETPLSAGLPPQKHCGRTVPGRDEPAHRQGTAQDRRLRPHGERGRDGRIGAGFACRCPPDPAELSNLVLTTARGQELCGAYYVYVQRLQTSPPVKLILDTDMSGDCDDAGTLALLHALADRGECELLATVVNRKDKTDASAAAVDAINTYYGRPDISHRHRQARPDRSPAHQRLHAGLARRVSQRHRPRRPRAGRAGRLPPRPRRAARRQRDDLQRRRTLQPRRAVAARAGIGASESAPARGDGRRVSARRRHRRPTSAPIARRRRVVAAEWPGEIIWHGFEVGNALITGARLKQTPRTNPVRRAYELRRYQDRPSIEGGQPSYDQAAALFAVRGAEPELWEMSPRGRVRVEDDGLTNWQADATGNHTHAKLKGNPAVLAHTIECLMIQPPH